MESRVSPQPQGRRAAKMALVWTLVGALGILVVASLAFTSPVEAAAPKITGATYVGSDTCKGCHAEVAEKMEHSLHGKLLGTKLSKGALQTQGCEGCHGPGSKHMENPADPAGNFRFGKNSPLIAADQNDVCLQCHARGKQILWAGSQHEARDVTCVTCHTVHGPASAKGQLKLVKQERYDSRSQLLDAVEYDLCGQCHQVKAMQFQRSSHMPMTARGEGGKMTVRKLPQSSRQHDRKAHLRRIHQRKLHDLPRRETGTVLVGARACLGELPKLPPGAWLEPPKPAQGSGAPPLSAVPYQFRAQLSSVYPSRSHTT